MTDPMNTIGDKKTLVEEGTEVKGSIRSTCPVLVRGRIEGEIDAPSLTVSPSGAVQGRAKVGDIRSEGEIAGEFDADVVTLSGTVKDKTVIRAKTLEVKLESPGSKLQVVFGECELDVGEVPAKGGENKKKKGQAGDGHAPDASEAKGG
jgi:cytoskeletal protein CcmA (bactofilin family)